MHTFDHDVVVVGGGIAGGALATQLARAGIDGDEEGWAPALALGATLPEDSLTLFLTIARAARDGRACPSEIELAQIYGTASLGRLRRVVGHSARGEEVCELLTRLGGAGESPQADATGHRLGIRHVVLGGARCVVPGQGDVARSLPGPPATAPGGRPGCPRAPGGGPRRGRTRRARRWSAS